MAQVEKIETLALKPLLLTVEQAGKLLGIKRALAYDLVAKGVLPTVKLGERSTRVPLEALENMVREMAGTPQDPAPAPDGTVVRIK